MAFSVEIKNDKISPVIFLKDDDKKTHAEIYSFGALLNAFTMGGSINVIDGYDSQQQASDTITNGFKSAKLSPYVCRIAKGKYVFNKQQYKIGKFFLGKESIHGLLFDADFAITNYGSNEDAAFATLQYNYANEDEGYPFNYICAVTYNLKKNNTLTIITSVKNNSDTEMPVCDGWHPYFKLDASIDELLFQLNANKILEFDGNLIPTGEVMSYNKFQQPEIIGDTFFDNCFLLNENYNAACIIKNKKSGLELTIQPDESYPYLQLYTPEHRNSIAIENLSAAPDAFNNKMGIKILKPGEIFSFKTTYTASVKL